MKLAILHLIQAYCLQYNVDYQIAVSIVAVESGFNVNAIGPTNDRGLFQLNPRSFPQYTPKQLLDPSLNIKLGVRYLAEVKKNCKYKKDLNWVLCYNVGMKRAKTIKHPSLHRYVLKVKTQLALNEGNL
jgi:soluble lytic murein transglycosylase-like protein